MELWEKVQKQNILFQSENRKSWGSKGNKVGASWKVNVVKINVCEVQLWGATAGPALIACDKQACKSCKQKEEVGNS